jgi:hypothetical protein
VSNSFVRAPNRFGYEVDVLWLDDGLEVILENLGKVIFTPSACARHGLPGHESHSAILSHGNILGFPPSQGDYRTAQDLA